MSPPHRTAQSAWRAFLLLNYSCVCVLHLDLEAQQPFLWDSRRSPLEGGEGRCMYINQLSRSSAGQRSHMRSQLAGQLVVHVWRVCLRRLFRGGRTVTVSCTVDDAFGFPNPLCLGVIGAGPGASRALPAIAFVRRSISHVSVSAFTHYSPTHVSRGAGFLHGGLWHDRLTRLERPRPASPAHAAAWARTRRAA